MLNVVLISLFRKKLALGAKTEKLTQFLCSFCSHTETNLKNPEQFAKKEENSFFVSLPKYLLPFPLELFWLCFCSSKFLSLKLPLQKGKCYLSQPFFTISVTKRSKSWGVAVSQIRSIYFLKNSFGKIARLKIQQSGRGFNIYSEYGISFSPT